MTTTELIRAALAEAEARERRHMTAREGFDADLSPADLARGTMGETWIMDEIEKASSGPWKHPARKARRFDWLGFAFLAMAVGVAAGGLAVIFGGW